jgi:hypothetical protein
VERIREVATCSMKVLEPPKLPPLVRDWTTDIDASGLPY